MKKAEDAFQEKVWQSGEAASDWPYVKNAERKLIEMASGKDSSVNVRRAHQHWIAQLSTKIFVNIDFRSTCKILCCRTGELGNTSY